MRQQQASLLDVIPDGGDAGALELLVVPVPELGPAGFGVEPERGLLGGKPVDPAVGPGAERVLLLFSQVSPQRIILLFAGDEGGGAIEEESCEEEGSDERERSHSWMHGGDIDM